MVTKVCGDCCTKFFQSGSPDNVPPGMVIDNKVCHPRGNDFYLCAHTGMINLYNANVRKVVFMGLAPIGCAPYYLSLYDSNNGECVHMINDMILEFNFVVRYMVEELAHELIDVDIIFCDAYEASMDIMTNNLLYGFNVTADACCGLGPYRGWMMCLTPEMACSNASNHIWWDQFHPTDAVNEILADNVWSGLHTEICYPMNLQNMIAQKAKNDLTKLFTIS